MAKSADSPVIPSARRFATTRWSLVLQARSVGEAPARAALEELCEAYWLPVYAFIRQQSRDFHTAQDLTQAFFTSLLTRDAFADLHPDRGRFRSFLLAAARNFLSNDRDRNTAAIRGGRVVLHSLDCASGERQMSDELARGESAEAIYERRWALALLDRVLDLLRREYERGGRLDVFESLSPHLSGDVREESLMDVARALDVTPEAARSALHRLRKRYRRLLHEEIAQTTDSSEDVDDEIRHLFLALRRNT